MATAIKPLFRQSGTEALDFFPGPRVSLPRLIKSRSILSATSTSAKCQSVKVWCRKNSPSHVFWLWHATARGTDNSCPFISVSTSVYSCQAAGLKSPASLAKNTVIRSRQQWQEASWDRRNTDCGLSRSSIRWMHGWFQDSGLGARRRLVMVDWMFTISNSIADANPFICSRKRG